MLSPDQIKQLIQAALPDAAVEVASDDGVHFAACVAASAFAGKSVVAQHRLVYDALGGRMGNEIHALSLRTKAPETAQH
ncbi:MAG: BolA/IbaG family iron-sulfur metabolism protein [Salinisphaera sp.]|nr:BolA/IbaG family iron-sulfur metabolism protein [Salinisphaera sp.]